MARGKAQRMFNAIHVSVPGRSMQKLRDSGPLRSFYHANHRKLAIGGVP